MAKINEIKQQKIVVGTVGSFAGSLQQIAASRMVTLRKAVMASRKFVEEATVILKELKLEQKKQRHREYTKLTKKHLPVDRKHAIIVVTSNQGLSGSYNNEIFKRVDQIVLKYPKADYFVLGHKGQEYFIKLAKKRGVKYFPYNISEEVMIEDLRPLIGMFDRYSNINLVYSKYINTATREVVFLDLAVPNIPEEEAVKEIDEGKFIFEPSVDTLVTSVSSKLRYALFRQQILDSKLSLYTAQMLAMKTASDNAEDLLKELQMEYNKQRRKAIDKKIQEVQAGRSLWAEE